MNGAISQALVEYVQSGGLFCDETLKTGFLSPIAPYVSYKRLPQEWESDEACPVLPELVIEIISPGQTFGQMTQKATDYLLAEASRVWVVDTQAQSVTIFQRDNLPQTFWSDETIEDSLLPGFEMRVSPLFTKKGG
jgi:Uma2 family endonuclease